METLGRSYVAVHRNNLWNYSTNSVRKTGNVRELSPILTSDERTFSFVIILIFKRVADGHRK
ncbi:hypothetical protein ACFQRK_15190 [Parapedobacter sp. GCM10030251]|uniref:hypothetical protein n=1 Tax=Parapedobacter sp. GCM10030251 TaxID=3273419 RepID=UPI00360D8F4A